MASSTFVGRAHELARLDAGWQRSRAGRPSTVLVQGQAGVGKSALLAAFLSGLDRAHVLTASGDESETSLSFGVLHQLVPRPTARWEDAFAAGAALLAELDRTTRAGPSVVVVDDAHLADAASLSAISFALRRLREDPVLAVLACRDDGAARLPEGLLRLAEGQDARLRLPGLSDGDVMALVAARRRVELSPRAAARLRSHTDGNPSFLHALVDELPAELLSASSGPLPVPSSHAAVISGAVARLSREAQSLARAAAILPDGTSLQLAGEVADVEEPEPAMDELVAARLLSCRQQERGWSVHFVHQLVRGVVEDELGPTASARLHRRAASLVTGEEALLHSVAAATGPEPRLAGQLDREAERSLARGDLGHAADLVLHAARVSEVGPSSDERLLRAVNLLVVDGDIARVKELAPRVAASPPTAQRLYLEAKTAWLRGEPVESEALATRAWAEGDRLGREQLGGVAALLAQLLNMRGDGAAAAEWAARALALELAPELVDSTSAARAFGLALDGRLPEALSTLEALPAASDAARTHGHRLTTRGVLRAALDDLSGARADLSLVCGATGGGLPPHRLLAMGALAVVEHRLGEWDRSLALAEQGVSLAEDSEQRWVLGFLHAAAVPVSAGRGEWGRAESHAAAAAALAADLADAATFAVSQDAEVHLTFCRGLPEEVVRSSELLHGLGGGPTHEPGLLTWPVSRCAALVQIGRHDQAEQEVAMHERAAAERGNRSRLAALARVRGELATARRDHRAARAAFEDAWAVGRAVMPVLDVALTHASHGRFLRRRGERRAAVEHLEQAHTQLSALGAAPYLQGCVEELAACGVAAGRPAETARSLLTAQEELVARLVCEGRTNQEVAHELVLSVKTVGYHLANVYQKLGIHSRTQLAALRGTGG
ncbi:MAG TPA: AAA family ATPase [Marmoricola sp.]|nr:AAA family ATPase [Marmoricola sp.]